jgi:hypothetical protein
MMQLESALLFLLVAYGVLIEAHRPFVASHLHLLRNSVHTLTLEGESAGQDAAQHSLQHLHIMAPDDILRENMSTRELAATITPVSYGENHLMTDTYPFHFGTSLVIASGTAVSFSELTFSAKCKTVGQSDSVDYGSGCAVIVPYNASLSLPDTFELEGGCIRILGGALFGAQNMTLKAGAKLQMQMDSIWVRNSVSAAKAAGKAAKGYDFTADVGKGSQFIHNTSYRGLFDIDSLTLFGGSGLYVTGGDSVAYQEAKQQLKLYELHVLDDGSFISAEGSGYEARGPMPFSSHLPSYTHPNHPAQKIEYNPYGGRL